MKRKGQAMVLEQVMLFSIGVVILVTSFALFMMYQSFYLTETTQDQIIQVREYILSNIVKMATENDYESQVVLSIPERMGGNFYRISLSDIGLNLTTGPGSEVSDFSALYGLNETFTFSGMVVSDRGKIVIYKKGDSINIQ